MEIPLDIRIPLSIEQGSVFNFHIEFVGVGRESKNRYFVVVNRNPKTDTVLIMVTSTTQVAKKKEFIKRAGLSERTLVLVSPKEYSAFNMESVFNCNDVYEVDIKDLIRKIEEGGSMNYPHIGKSILAKIIAGIRASTSVAPAFKKLL